MLDQANLTGADLVGSRLVGTSLIDATLADDPPVKAIGPMALGALGEAGDKEADRRLLVEYGDTAEGREAMKRLKKRA